MGTNPEPQTPLPEDILTDIRRKTDVLDKLKDERRTKGFKSVGAAIGFQVVENQRSLLQRSLPPLRLIAGTDVHG